MVLKECSCYETCITMYRESPERQKVPFTCNGCIGCRNYELGFMQGVKEAVKKINGCEPILVNKEQHYRDLLSWYRKKLKGE